MRITPLIVFTIVAAFPFYSSSPQASEWDGTHMEFSKIGDLELSCGALSEEAAAMRTTILEKEDKESAAEMRSHGVNAAAGIGSFLIGTATGGIGFAAAGLLASEAIQSDADESENMKYIAAQRRSLMIGIYKAKACHGPIEHVMLPAPQTEANVQFVAQASAPETFNNLSPASGNVRSNNLTHND